MIEGRFIEEVKFADNTALKSTNGIAKLIKNLDIVADGCEMKVSWKETKLIKISQKSENEINTFFKTINRNKLTI